MAYILALTSLYLSLASKSITHPVSFMAVILSQTIVICLSSTFAAPTPWFGFILFLIFMGGVMVLFVYMSSLASNENFLWETKELIMVIPLFFLAVCLVTTIPSTSPSFLNVKLVSFLVHLYSMKFMPFMACIISFLLFTLLVVSNAIKKNKAPIRSTK